MVIPISNPIATPYSKRPMSKVSCSGINIISEVIITAIDPTIKLIFLERWAKVALVSEAPITAVKVGAPIIIIWQVCPENERFQCSL